MSVTHAHTIDGGVFTKRYTSWERGEHRREWLLLGLVHANTTDLVPRPLDAALDADPPTIAMTRLPGRPLHGRLSPAQLTALEAALRELWAVPIGDLEPRGLAAHAEITAVRDLLAARPRPAHGEAGDAYDAALEWFDGTDPDHFRHPYPHGVVSQGDLNLANFLWDGDRVRIVDFEDGGRSDVAYELATLVEHLSARETDWTGFCAAFDVPADRLLAGRRLWAAFWLQMLLPGGRSAARNGPEALAGQARRVLGLMG